jgi:hypothetical protein
MKKVSFTVQSLAPYYQSRMHVTPKLEKEDPQAYEERTWREKCTVNEDGFVIIPPVAFRKSLIRAAKMLSMQIPNRGKSTYTKHFLAGLLIPVGITLPIKKENAECIAVNCHANGDPSSGRRVLRYFPEFKKWSGKLEVVILDETISEPVFERHAHEAGSLVGVGQNRPENGGSNGRYQCEKFNWTNI